MELTDLRREMDAIDRELLALFARRMALSGEIAGLKKAAALPVFDPAREEEKLRQAARSVLAASMGVSPSSVSVTVMVI